MKLEELIRQMKEKDIELEMGFLYEAEYVIIWLRIHDAEVNQE